MTVVNNRLCSSNSMCTSCSGENQSSPIFNAVLYRIWTHLLYERQRKSNDWMHTRTQSDVHFVLATPCKCLHYFIHRSPVMHPVQSLLYAPSSRNSAGVPSPYRYKYASRATSQYTDTAKTDAIYRTLPFQLESNWSSSDRRRRGHANGTLRTAVSRRYHHLVHLVQLQKLVRVRLNSDCLPRVTEVNYLY